MDMLCPYFFSYLAALFKGSHFLTAVLTAMFFTLCTMADFIVKLHIVWHISACGLTIGLLKQSWSLSLIFLECISSHTELYYYPRYEHI